MFQPKPLAALVLLVSTCVFTSLTAHAQGSGADKRDEAAIHDYVLTLPRVQAYAVALKDYEANGSKDSTIADECKGKLDDDKMALVDKAAYIDSHCPKMAAWIKQHGLTTKDFMFIPMSMITAGFAQVAIDAGGKAPDFVNPANLKFVKEHKEELTKMGISGSENTETDSKPNNSSDNN